MRLYSAKETYKFKEPTNHSHPIAEMCKRNSGAHRTATHRTILQHATTHCNTAHTRNTALHRNTSHHTASHYNILQHNTYMEHCTTPQHIAPYCNTLQYAAPRCTTLQHTAPHCTALQHIASHTVIHCNTHEKRRTTHHSHSVPAFPFCNVSYMQYICTCI